MSLASRSPTSWQRELVFVMGLAAQPRGRTRHKFVNVQHHPCAKLDAHRNVLRADLKKPGAVAASFQARVFGEAGDKLCQAVIVGQCPPHNLCVLLCAVSTGTCSTPPGVRECQRWQTGVGCCWAPTPPPHLR